jgi:Uma2 family endonuclease
MEGRIMSTAVKRDSSPVPRELLIASDGIPMESTWHVAAMYLLIDSISHRFQHRDDFFAGGNNFIYFSAEQARNKDYRGPDFYFVDHVPRWKKREYWAVWDEGGRYPDLLLELMSPTTMEEDLVTKKKIYEQVFKAREYFCYDPVTETLYGWRLGPHGRYRKISPNKRGWLWSDVLQVYVGRWKGKYLNVDGTFPRFFDEDGNLVLHGVEEAERLREELERMKSQRGNGRRPRS